MNSLREQGDWSPRLALVALGHAPKDSDILGHLLVALAAIQGPQRLELLASRLELECRKIRPRLQGLGADPSLASVKLALGEMGEGLDQALGVLPSLRARAANDESARPGGLRGVDVGLLARVTTAAIRALEVGTKPSLAGVSRALKLLSRPPDLGFASSWSARLMPGAPSTSRVRLAKIEHRGVLVVDPAGAIAYDPRAADL
ncbi:MAG: hypothetical protein IT384_24300 [Deltaproteobacteria bacterium]|nr:hypothetical protein [Deltaproteobacteria bacterium]